MDFKDSKTKKNLEAAFSGESPSGNPPCNQEELTDW